MQEQYFDWNSKERGLILSSFFWGYIMTQFLGGLFGARIGGNKVSEIFDIERQTMDLGFCLIILSCLYLFYYGPAKRTQIVFCDKVI